MDIKKLEDAAISYITKIYVVHIANLYKIAYNYFIAIVNIVILVYQGKAKKIWTLC